MIETGYGFVLSNATAFAVFAILFVAITCVVAIVLMMIAMKRLRIALDELRRARAEIRSYAPLKTVAKKSYQERLKEEYEKRGIPWEG